MRSGMYRPPLGARPLRTAYGGPQGQNFRTGEMRGQKKGSIDLFEGEEIAPASSRKILHRSTCTTATK